MPQQPQYIPPAPYHQQPIYPYPGYPQQPGQFVPMPPQQIIHQGQPGNLFHKQFYVNLLGIFVLHSYYYIFSPLYNATTHEPTVCQPGAKPRRSKTSSKRPWWQTRSYKESVYS